MTKKTPKHLRKVIWINTGFLPVKIGFCASSHAWDREMRKLKVQEASKWEQDGYSRTATTSTFHGAKYGGMILIVSLYQDMDAHETYLSLIHEAVHVWQFTCQRIKENAPGIEMEAYAIEHIVDGLVKAYIKTLGKGSHRKGWAG